LQKPWRAEQAKIEGLHILPLSNSLEADLESHQNLTYQARQFLLRAGSLV
jgi:hypothetical protein